MRKVVEAPHVRFFCGAKARSNNYAPCKKSPMANGRCLYHGGASTGPKTIEGRLRCAQAKLKHGAYTKEKILERQKMHMMMQWRKDLNNL